MKLLDDYNKLRENLFEYFGYVEDWCVYPLDDATMYYWYINGSETDGEVHFSEDKDELDMYSNEIYTQRFLNKWVYRGEDYTMIIVDTCVDGNKFLQIFDNDKEVNPDEES